MFSHQVSNTRGMSQTDSESYSSELGVSLDGLGGKLSTTFSTSITIEASQTDTNTYSINIPEGQTAVYTIWQLIASFQVLDANGFPCKYSGVWPSTDPFFQVSFPTYKAEAALTTINSDPVIFSQ